MNQSKLKKNVIIGFGGQLIIIVLGIIVPRITLTSYGSDVNGLLSTISQIYTYMALLEAGIGQAARNALYKPITEHDRDGISYISSIASRYFHRITVYYGIGVLVLSVLMPFILKTDVDNVTVFLVILFEGMAGVISFYFIQTPSIILTADGKGYVNNGINVANKVVSYSAKIVIASLGINIAILQFVYFLITIAKVVIYQIYFNKRYGWINYSCAPKGAKLKDRNAYIITEIAWTMFSSTDMIVLSMFVSTQLSSVYSIYNLVFSNINTLLNAVYSSVNYLLGQTYHESMEKYARYHDAFTSIFFGGMTILMCVAYILILPFVRLYTAGVTDTEYIYEALPVLFCLVQILSWSRYITGNLTGVAGYAKPTSRISLIEAITNIVLSVILVQRFGIVGVLFATVIALPIKVIYCTYVGEKKVLKRSPVRYILILAVNYLYFGVVVWIDRFINLQIDNYLQFLGWGVILTVICTAVGVLINVAVNPSCMDIFRKMVRRK